MSYTKDCMELIDMMDTSCIIHDSNVLSMIDYIKNLHISLDIKQKLLHLVENDNHSDYIEIYNICIENDIEIPPI